MSLNQEQTPVVEDCPVCIESYNKRRTKIECPSCSYSVCIGCTKRYLLSTPEEPHCMNCHKGWERDTQYELLGKSFVNGELNKHRVSMLYDKERSKFPTTQPYVDAVCDVDKINKEQEKLIIQMQNIKGEYNRLEKEKRKIEREIIGKKIPSVRTENFLKCPKDNCRGYISKNECKMCHSHICRKCLVLLDNADALKEHECDKDTLETAQLILKSSKPCPTCGTRISKVSGCDQMWCPNCEVAFSWTTGMVVRGVVHNPHFYEYQRRRGNTGGNINRNEGDVVCGGVVSYRLFDDKMKRVKVYVQKDEHDKHKLKTMIQSMYDCHRVTIHFQDVVVRRLRVELRDDVNNIKERADFMMDKITEEQFKRVVIKRDKKREKNQSCLHIYETLVTMFTERINAYVVDQNLSIEVDQNLSIENLENTLDELIQIRIFIQEQFTRVSKNYNMTVECFGTYSRLNSAKNVFTVCKRKLV
jgi:hypothetical protein